MTSIAELRLPARWHLAKYRVIPGDNQTTDAKTRTRRQPKNSNIGQDAADLFCRSIVLHPFIGAASENVAISENYVPDLRQTT